MTPHTKTITTPQGKEYQMNTSVSIEEIEGKYAWNERSKVGGIISYGNESYVEIGNSVYHTITGDCLYDSLTINGFKVYENNNNTQG